MIGDITNGESVDSVSNNHISVRSTNSGKISFDKCTDQYDVNVLNVNSEIFGTTSVLSVNSDRGNKEVESNMFVLLLCIIIIFIIYLI